MPFRVLTRVDPWDRSADSTAVAQCPWEFGSQARLYPLAFLQNISSSAAGEQFSLSLFLPVSKLHS